MKQTKLFLVLVIFGTLCTTGCSKRRFTMSSGPMMPTIMPGQTVTADMSAYDNAPPKRWDVVVFHEVKNPKPFMISRIVGLPGETVSFKNGDVLINGKPVAKPKALQKIYYRLRPTITTPVTPLPHPFHVPLNAYYVLGDNTNHAYDSRFWGAVPRANIVGRVKIK